MRKRVSRLQDRSDRLWSPPTFLVCGYRLFFSAVERLGREVGHSPPPSTEVKNEWSWTSTFPICLHGVYEESYFFFLKPYQGLPSACIPFGSPTRNLYALPLFAVPNTFPIITHLDFINCLIFGEEYKSWSSSLCSFLQNFFFFFLDPIIFLNILFLNTLRPFNNR